MLAGYAEDRGLARQVMPAGNIEFSRLCGVQQGCVQQVMLAAKRCAVDCAEINLGRKITLSQQVRLNIGGGLSR